MCGVIGILGCSDLTRSRDLLLLLTHRGQDASGILWLEDDGFATAKTIGGPSSIVVPSGSSEMLLGSTRYPTSGKRVISAELESFVGPFHNGSLALSHNGNITNMLSVSNKGYDCDTEFLTDRLALHLDKTGSLPDAFRLLVAEVDGAYSLVGIHNDRLFAFRDSKGFKPLVFGRAEKQTIVASENTVLNMAGMSLERDVYPGELLIFGPNSSMESHSIMQSESHNHCFFEYVYFAHPASTMESHLVYDVRFRLGRALAKTFNKMKLELPDYVVPVPDTSRPAAQALAETLEVPMREIILKNRYLGRTFIAPDHASRDYIARSKYIYLTNKVGGNTILVVDDSIVRGTTAKKIVTDLRELGAERIYFAATCPPQSHACYYGIDIATDKELIASESSLDEIAEYIGADALIYQEMDGLVNAIGLNDLCLACLDGRYPTEHARRIREHVGKDSGTENCRDYERALEK